MTAYTSCLAIRVNRRLARRLASNTGVEGESESWDFGVGAGFYVNATQPKWKNWRMYEYVTEVRACVRACVGTWPRGNGCCCVRRELRVSVRAPVCTGVH